MSKKNFVDDDAAYKMYQDRSGASTDRADQLAWMFIVLMAGGLVSGHVYNELFVCAGCACVYMLLSILQCVWQAVSAWVFLNQIRRQRARFSGVSDKDYVWPKDFPDYMGFGAWLFYYLKLGVITYAVCYFVYEVIC